VCGNILTIREYVHGPNAYKLPFDVVQFCPDTGKEIARKHHVQGIKDICDVKFN
jgi:hypothetical protein